jgi:RNA polymerase primary sigma factor
MRQLTITSGTITPRDAASVNSLLSEIRKYKTFTKEEEVDIFKRYNETQDVTLFNEIVHRNIKFVVSVAKKYHNRNLQLSDLISSGCIGLIKSINSFDQSLGYKFSTFAVWGIRSEIISYIENNGRYIRLPGNVINNSNKIEKKINQEITLSEDEEKIMNYKHSTRTVSLDAPVYEDLTLLDTVENINSDNPVHGLFSNDKQIFIRGLLEKHLKPREVYIMNHLYQLNGYKYKPTTELAVELGISVNRINDLKSNSLRRLKSRLKEKQLKLVMNNIFQ